MQNNNAAVIAEHIRKETRNNVLINMLLNAAIAYATLSGVSALSAWGEHSYGKDLIITGFILGAILSGIFIAVTRSKCSNGDMTPEGDDRNAMAWLIPYKVWGACLWIGVLSAAIAAPLLIALLGALGMETLPPTTYALIKGVWAGLLAGIIVPVAIRQGLRQRPPKEGPV